MYRSYKHPGFFTHASLTTLAALQLLSVPAWADLALYEETLARGWQDGSWGVTRDFQNGTPTHSGAASIAATFDQGSYSALRLANWEPVTITGAQALRFWMHGGESGGQHDIAVKVCVQLDEDCQTYAMPEPVANTWTQVEIPLANFPGSQVSDLQWYNQGGNQPTFYLDDIVFVGTDTLEKTQVLYDDALSSRWQEWSTNTLTDPASANPTHSGQAALAVTSTEGWNTFQLGFTEPVDLTGLNTLRFWIHGGDIGGQKLQVTVTNDAGENTIPADITAQAGVWTEVEIPLAALGGTAGGEPLTIYSIRWWNSTASAQPTYYLDDIALVARDGTGETDGGTSTETADPSLIYVDAVQGDWVDGSWNMDGTPVVGDFASPAVVHSGTAAIRVDRLQGWGAMSLDHTPALDADGFDTLRFWIHGGETGGQQLTVTVRNEAWLESEPLVVEPQPGIWTQVEIPLRDVLTPLNLVSVQFYNASDRTQPTFYLDDLTLVNTGTGTTQPPATTGTGPALSVDTRANRHAISPYIYGMNFADETLARELRLPVRRWGGNHTSRYNWQIDTSNRGVDWYYENVAESNATNPDQSSANQFIEQDRRTGTATLMTAPILGWVSSTRSGCSYSIRKYGDQQDADWQWRPDCGNGMLTDGTRITWNDPSDTSLAIGPEFVKEWVDYLSLRYGSAHHGGVQFYSLDNEPMLWNSTHPDVHPEPTSLDELVERSIDAAEAIKAADPSAQTVGPALWGWCAYFYSAVDDCSNNGTADYRAHGNKPVVEWYLEQMQAHEQQTGVRILDYLDLHIYPQGNGVFSRQVGSKSTQALRLRSTRSLWDPNYRDESWIPDAIRLIPRMKSWVQENYPGTKLAISEYSWGALGYLNGALAQADILGIFGREGLDLATLWEPPTATQPGAMAFRMYRNYDGQGSAFGDLSVSASSADQDQLAIYAATRQEDGALTLMIVNKSASDLTSHLNLDGLTPSAMAQVYRYSAAQLSGIVQEADLPVAADGLTTTFPAASITLLVVPSAGENTPPETSEPPAPETPVSTCAIVPANVTLDTGDMVRDRNNKKRYTQTLTLTNTGTQPVTGPLFLVLDGLSSKTKLVDANGLTTCASPEGSPYQMVSTTDLTPHTSLTVNLVFTQSGSGVITYTPRVLAGTDAL
jgi:hypothetical protein